MDGTAFGTGGGPARAPLARHADDLGARPNLGRPAVARAARALRARPSRRAPAGNARTRAARDPGPRRRGRARTEAGRLGALGDLDCSAGARRVLARRRGHASAVVRLSPVRSRPLATPRRSAPPLASRLPRAAAARVVGEPARLGDRGGCARGGLRTGRDRRLALEEAAHGARAFARAARRAVAVHARLAVRDLAAALLPHDLLEQLRELRHRVGADDADARPRARSTCSPWEGFGCWAAPGGPPRRSSSSRSSA